MSVKCPSCGAVFGGTAASLPKATSSWCGQCGVIHEEGKHVRPAPIMPTQAPVNPRPMFDLGDDEVTPTRSP